MSFIDRMHEFGTALGIGPLVPDSSGSVSLQFDDDLDLVITEDATDNTVFIYAELGVASPDASAETWKALLKASLLGAETDGAAFALNGNMVVLWKRHDPFPDCASLEKAVTRMLPQAMAWKENLVELAHKQRTGSSEPLPPTSFFV